MNIIFRADGDSVTGLGHIMRSSALMQMLQDDFSCSFYTKEPAWFPYKDFNETPTVFAFDHKKNDEAKQLVKQLFHPSIIVLDGYGFDTQYQSELKNAGHYVVCIDDIINYHFVADIIINHAGGVEPSAYSAETYTRFCLGPSYALVKPLFFSVPGKKDPGKRNLFISLGGADPGNDTEKVLDIAANMNFENIDAVLGAANKNAGHLGKKYANDNIVRVHRDLSSAEMFSLMSQSYYAVLSPSTVCYEFMSTTGAVFLYQIADNQQRIKDYFLKEGLAFSFDEIGRIKEEKITEAGKKQQQLFDGRSGKRFIEVFSQLANKITV